MNALKRTDLLKSNVRMELGLALLLILSCLSVISSVGCSTGSAAGEPKVLARVEVPGYLEELNLPVYADIEDAEETYYALVIATKTQLDNAGVAYRIIDEYVPGTRYLIAREEVEGARTEAAGLVNVLYDDGEHIVVRYKVELSELLPEIGFDINFMSQYPIWSGAPNPRTMDKASRSAAAVSFVKNSKVEAMLKAVAQEDVELATQYLSGEKDVQVDRKMVTISSRHTYREGTKVKEATQYVYDQLDAMKLSPSFAEWTVEYGEGTLSNRNVIGEIKGQTTPEEIVILIAHLDTVSSMKDGNEPGADDNASGCVGLLTAARIMSSLTDEPQPKRVYNFKRTIRFVFTTGEEQSLYGGTAYAKAVYEAGQKIVAVLNLDMIGFSEIKDPPVKPKQQIKIRNKKFKTAYEKDLPVAQTYLDVVTAYGMDQVFEAVLTPDGEACSDHAPFWTVCKEADPTSQCYSAAWAIEYAEDGFINPKMHSADDRLKLNNKYHMNLPYYTAVVKAALGTAAHLAQPVN